MPWGKAAKVKIVYIDMVIMCTLIDSTCTVQGFQAIIGIALVCVLDSNTIGFPCVLPVCFHPKEHVVWWYHKHGIPSTVTFFVVATLYSIFAHHDIQNLGFQ